jgi:hypothetical protein
MGVELARCVGAGMLQSPACYGPYGTLVSRDGNQQHQLQQPLTATELEDVCKQVDRDEIMLAHVTAAAFRKTLFMHMLHVSVCDIYRMRVLGEQNPNTKGKLSAANTIVSLHDIYAPVPDMMALQTFIRPRDRSAAPWHSHSHIVVASESGESGGETLHQVMAQLQVSADEGVAQTSLKERQSGTRNASRCSPRS